ncbi:MAG: replication factor C small subunit [Promethearchaeota archaeon]
MALDLETPWVEKYRPKTFDDIVRQNVAISNLKKFVNSGNMPHMIFSGPAGTGKTSTALIVARSLIKEEHYYRNILELNASDTVRMDYVRTVLKDFTNQSMNFGGSELKIVILDEADNIPTQVQQALRRIIEITSNRVKFILMCNYIDKIIDPIVSRCAVFRFVDLPKEKIIERLRYIASQEKLKIPKNKEKEFYETLYFISGGDLRKAINTMQMSVALELLTTNNLDINEILRISGFIDKPTIGKLKKILVNGNFVEALEILKSIEYLDSRNFLRQLLNIITSFNFDQKQFGRILAYIGDIDYRISQGSDELIQLGAMIAKVVSEIKAMREEVST